MADRVAVLLCGAEGAGNVGSACRAMKTMGFGRLILVGCPSYDEDSVKMMAVHAYDVYEAAERRPDLASALACFAFSAGFTRRRGERRKAFSQSVGDFADEVLRRPKGDIALVFGNERAGLTGAELGLCSLAVHIPTAEAFPSLNLAMAVQIACYELRKAAIGERDGSARNSEKARKAVASSHAESAAESPSLRSETDEAVARIAEYLRGIGFFKVTRDRDLSAFMRDTVERAAFSPSELRYFESIFRKAAGMIRGAADR